MAVVLRVFGTSVHLSGKFPSVISHPESHLLRSNVYVSYFHSSSLALLLEQFLLSVLYGQDSPKSGHPGLDPSPQIP